MEDFSMLRRKKTLGYSQMAQKKKNSNSEALYQFHKKLLTADPDMADWDFEKIVLTVLKFLVATVMYQRIEQDEIRDQFLTC